jgi:hypothetical protein
MMSIPIRQIKEDRPVFKKQLFLAPAVALIASLSFASSVFALDYSNRQGNKATFETLEEARQNGAAAAASTGVTKGRAFKSHPALDGYPKGTTFVYRSANLFGGRGIRCNTNILVFAEKSFLNNNAALAYLKGLGVIDIIDNAVGSAVLITPADPKAGFTASDQKHYYALQTAMLSLRASERVDNVITTYTDAEYFGGFGFLYAIGIDGGATFFNNYIASSFDCASRLAGVLLINGKMDEIYNVASILPAYLVNASDAAQTKYKAANHTDAVRGDSKTTTYFNEALPLQQVIVRKETSPDLAAIARKAYDEVLSRAMRIPVVKQGLYSAGTPYQGYNYDQAPYSLSARNVVANGVTPSGISVFRRQEARFSNIKTKSGEYLQTWIEYIPNEVLEKKAEGDVPLVIAFHGGGDDPEAFVEEVGWLELAGRQRLIVVAPEHQNLDADHAVLGDASAALAAYMMATYPAIDASRVYVSGYSMGGEATLVLGTSHPRMLAAAVDMAGAMFTFSKESQSIVSEDSSIVQVQQSIPRELPTQFKEIDLPFMFLTSAYDSTNNVKWEDGSITNNVQVVLNKFLMFNKMNQIGYDFTVHPKCGFQADAWTESLLKNEHKSYTWYLNNKNNVPMVALSYTADLIHALYPEYARIAWNYMAHFSRDQKTGAIKYTPYMR